MMVPASRASRGCRGGHQAPRTYQGAYHASRPPSLLFFACFSFNVVQSPRPQRRAANSIARVLPARTSSPAHSRSIFALNFASNFLRPFLRRSAMSARSGECSSPGPEMTAGQPGYLLLYMGDDSVLRPLHPTPLPPCLRITSFTPRYSTFVPTTSAAAL
jgi:hypothetical protein